MTHQVRKGYRNHRRATWVVALAVAVVAALVAVLPALGTGTSLIPPPSGLNVTPKKATAGPSSFNCATNTGGVPAGMSTFRVSSVPASATSATYNSTSNPALPAGITIKITGVSGSNAGKFFSFETTGVRVFHVGVYGDDYEHAWYNYATPYPSGATADSGLHATKDDGYFTKARWTTFCYKPAVKIQGNVYQDTNSDGAKNGAESGLARTVSVLGGPSMTTGNDGNYTLYVAPGGTYKVCVTATGSEAQTQPTGNTNCSANPGVAGYQFTPTQDVSGADFGLTGGVTGSCGSELTAPTTGGPTYGATVSGADCATKVAGQKLVFTTWSDGSGQFASLRPTSYSGPPCDVGANTNCLTVLEQLTWNLPAGSDPKLLKYDDTLPYNDFITMPFCKVDPRTGTFAPADVLPPLGGAYHTSCLIESTQEVVNGTGWHVERVDAVYSAVDGGRQIG